MLDLSTRQPSRLSEVFGVFRRTVRRLFPRLIALSLALSSAFAADDSVSTPPPLCRVTLTVDESGKATVSLKSIGTDPEDRSSCKMCQQQRLGNGVREFNYCFGDPKAMDFLSGPLGNPVNVSLIKESRMLRLQPAAAKGWPIPCAAFTLPYRVTIPFTLSYDVSAPDESGGQTGAFVFLHPRDTGVSTKGPSQINLAFTTPDRFTKVVGIAAKALYAQDSSKSNELGDWDIDLANNPGQISFQLPLPAKASDNAYRVDIGAAGAIACGLSRLCVTTNPSPVAGVGLRQVGDVIVVESVLEFSAAQKAGVRLGDQLLSINGQEMSNLADAMAAFAETTFGENTVVEVGRRGESISLTLAMREPSSPPEIESDASLKGGVASQSVDAPDDHAESLARFEDQCKKLCLGMAAACLEANGKPTLAVGSFADTKFVGFAGRLDAQSKGTGISAGCANGTVFYFSLYGFLVMEATARMAGQEPPQGGVVDMANGWMKDGSEHLVESGDADKYWTQVAATYSLLQLYGDGNRFNAALDAQLLREGQQPLVNQLVGGVQRLRSLMCDRLAKQYAASVEVGLKKFGPPRIADKTTEAAAE